MADDNLFQYLAMTEDNLLEVGDIITMHCNRGAFIYPVRRVNHKSVSLNGCPILLDRKVVSTQFGYEAKLKGGRTDHFATWTVNPKF